ncbi:MAG: M24 family metallopeptidase [Sporichthyaceae bacterium]
MSSAAASVFADRLARARAATAAAGLGALLVTPGPDLRYLTGYVAKPLERLTCLVLPADADPVLVVPFLERQAAEDAGIAALGLEIADWQETDDPIELVAKLLPAGTANYGVDDHMWAEKVLRLRMGMPAIEQRLAGGVLRDLRVRKAADEVDALREAGRFIDSVHSRIGEWLKPGRTEREIGRDIADAIVAAGHVRADFVIVGSGPNGASPHHDVSDRVVQAGDPVVVDIGGTTEAGYCSDSTRTYCVGEPDAEFRRYYEVLLASQIAACDAVRPGIECQEVDRVARAVISDAGYGEYFIHRTGHGIGLEGHEHPYMVEGNAEILEPGMAFSVEPGIYLPGRHGARIEDILVCTESGGERLNLTSRELTVLPV